jgi:hypothetical protein
MGFDTSGGDPEAGGGGTIFDDPQFMESLQGVMQQQPQGGGYEQDPWAGSGGAASQEEMYRRPRRKYMGGGGGVYDPDFGDPRRAQGMGGGGGVVSAPDGTVYGGGATSPFEVGPSSGAPNTLHAAQQPSGGGYGRFPGMGGDLRGGGGGRRPLGPESRGGWYGGYGNQGGGGQQQFYGPQGPQGQSRPDSSNPGAAYDAGPGKMEAQQQSLRDQGAQQGAPPRWQMPQGGAYGRPQMQRRRRFYGNSGAIQGPQGSPGRAPVGGGY